jgi:predicted small secreted protein
MAACSRMSLMPLELGHGTLRTSEGQHHFHRTAKGLKMKIIATAMLAAMLAMLAGCNTVEGAGRDVKATGAAVEKAADKAKPN